jgi:hypothetical protein
LPATDFVQPTAAIDVLRAEEREIQKGPGRAQLALSEWIRRCGESNMTKPSAQ